MDNIFKKIKNEVNICDVLAHYGVSLDANGKALCPFHKEDTPSFSVKKEDNIFKCFGCEASGDSVAFVSKLKGIEPLEAAKEIAEIFLNDYSHVERQSRKLKESESKHYPRRDSDKPVKSQVKDYISVCMGNISQTNYFKLRGLNDDTIKKFCLGFDAKKQAVVLPYSSKLEYYQTRSVKDKTFYKPPTKDVGQEPLFNRDALYKSKQPVFIVESPICALSIMQCGGVAVSLCGTGITKLVKECKSKKPSEVLILSLDNDEPGKTAQAELASQLFELGVKFYVANISYQCKDQNELLITNELKLKNNIGIAIKKAKQKYRTAKDSISVTELFSQNHRKPKEIVKSLIVEGLTLLCAPQKIGKSWLALDLCLSVTQGKDFWDYATLKCDSLYYTLEDPPWRIKERIQLLSGNEEVPSNMYFITEADKLGAGFIEHLQNELDENKKIGLVIIDTLKLIRKVNTSSSDIYGHDYEELVILKKFAEKNNIAIILVHHTRKAKDDGDPFANVLGTGGLTGAVDTTLVMMKKKRSDKETVLHITGRDVREREEIIEWGGSPSFKWYRIGDMEEIQEKRERDEYLNDPLVKTIKAIVKKQPYGWEGTSTDLLKLVYDYTQNTSLSALIIGSKISKWSTKLYYDGIEHTDKKVRGQKKHVFYKRSYLSPQMRFFASKNEENE